MAWNAGIITLVGTLVIFAIAKWLIGSTKVEETAEAVTPKIYGMRKNYFFLLLILIVVTLFASLRDLPYSPPGDETPEYKVSITGKMWSWEITEMKNIESGEVVETIPVGTLVEFLVSAEDVNHGIGIYNEAGQILTQTQAMPGYPASIYYRFSEGGTYHIVCMEYCGAGHTVMNSQIQVN